MGVSADLNFAKIMAKVVAEKKAIDIKILDLNGKSDICDYQVICSGESDRQVQAIAQEVDRVARKDLGIKPSNIEGTQTGQWILIDFGATMVHVFLQDTRNYYAIEQLWPEADKITLKSK